MNNKLLQFVRETQARGGRIPVSSGQCRRELHTRDLVDTAVIGGETLADILDGKVTDQQMPRDIIDAFHLQFPNEPSLVAMVQKHSGSDLEMRGIISAVKGKLFELRYTEWLNNGHLPPGYLAKLAQSPTQPDWDLEIKDDHGQVVQHVQAKATGALSIIREALDRHPEIDVVTTRGAFLKAADDPGLKQHLINSGVSNHELTTHVKDGVEQVYSPEFHIPILALAWIAIQTYRDIRNKKQSRISALKEGGRRGGFAMIASASAYASQLLTGFASAGLPAAIATRMILSRAEHNRRLVKSLESIRDRSRGRCQRFLTT